LGHGALRAPDDPAQWEAAIEQAITTRAGLRQIAEQARDQLACQNPAAVQQELWRGIFQAGF
jgi:hypothetical protein